MPFERIIFLIALFSDDDDAGAGAARARACACMWPQNFAKNNIWSNVTFKNYVSKIHLENFDIVFGGGEEFSKTILS